MIKVILWDIDGTLLNFHAAEAVAIRRLFTQFNLGECTDEMLARYVKINDKYWQRLEKGLITKPEVLLGRFEEFFAGENLDTSVAAPFNEAYQLALGDTIVFNDDSKAIIESLKGQVKQYIVTNGTKIAQEKKLTASGLGEVVDGVFISEDIGIEKPNVGYFDRVFEQIGHYEPDEVIIIGDSLTSDITGGMNVGIRTCWYNPDKKEIPSAYRVDYSIADLHEVPAIISGR